MNDLPEWAVDAADIPDTACVLRRLPPISMQVDEHGLPSTSNFRERDDPSTGLSVTYWQGQSDVDDVLRSHEEFGLFSIVVADIRATGLIVARVPFVGNLNHCEIFGNVTKGVRKRLKESSRWVRLPPALDVAFGGVLEVYQATNLPRAVPKA